MAAPDGRFEAAPWRFQGTVYRPRHPTQTALYQAVQHHVETLVARAAEPDPVGYGLPERIERNSRATSSAAFWPAASLGLAVRIAATSG